MSPILGCPSSPPHRLNFVFHPTAFCVSFFYYLDTPLLLPHWSTNLSHLRNLVKRIAEVCETEWKKIENKTKNLNVITNGELILPGGIAWSFLYPIFFRETKPLHTSNSTMLEGKAHACKHWKVIESLVRWSQYNWLEVFFIENVESKILLYLMIQQMPTGACFLLVEIINRRLYISIQSVSHVHKMFK